MFRELVRKKQRLSEADCLALLIKETRGVLSVLGDDDYPYGMPMNHWYCEEDGCIYFHCGKTGHRIDALRRYNKVSFCVFANDSREEDGWAWNVKSVIVFGRIEIIDDIDKIIPVAAALSYKFTQDEAYIRQEIERSARHTLLLRLIPEHICGKLVNEA